MKLIVDLHTHSKFSRFFHGKSSIEEIAVKANELGLREVAITDHGYRHFFRTSKEKLLKARKIIDEINTWSKTKVLLGIEADIINQEGDLDIDEETLDNIDILLAGYHRMIPTDFAGIMGGQKKTAEAVEIATKAYLNAIDRWPITIITHLDSVLTTDLFRVGRACKDNGILVEINNRHTNWNDKQIQELLSSDCTFIVSSDAHCSDDVGRADNAFELIKKYKIPAQSVSNVEFEENELTARDKEDRFYLNLYRQLSQSKSELLDVVESMQPEEQKPDPMKNVPIDKTKSVLSSEMEDALEKIAMEKGIRDYSRGDGKQSVNISDYQAAKEDEAKFSEELEKLNSEELEKEELQRAYAELANIRRNSPAAVGEPVVNEPETAIAEPQIEKAQENTANIAPEENNAAGDEETSQSFESSSQSEPKKSYMSHIEFNAPAAAAQPETREEEVLTHSEEDENLLSVTGALNNYRGGARPNIQPQVQKDSDYYLSNNQEQVLGALKSQAQPSEQERGYTGEFQNDLNDFMGEDFGSENFNTNESRPQSRTESVEINRSSDYYKSARTEENTAKPQAPEKTTPQKRGGGFVDFSNFNDDK